MIIISAIASLLVYGVAAVLIIKIMSQSGITLSEKLFWSSEPKTYNTKKGKVVPERYKAKPDDGKTAWKIFVAAFCFRLFMFGVQLCLSYILIDFPNIAQLNEFNGIFAKALRQFQMWDASNYYRIAEGGYGSHTENGMFTMLAFFPLQSWIARYLSIFLGGNIRLALLTVSSLAFSGACAILYRLLIMDYSDRTAKRAVLYISIFPFSFFFGTMQAESLLFFTFTLSMYFSRRHMWAAAAAAGFLASMTRIVGILAIVPAAVEFIEHYKLCGALKDGRIKEVILLILKKGSVLLAMFLGLGIYLWLNYYYTGDFFKFMEYQEKVWYHTSCYFGTGIANVFGEMLGCGLVQSFVMYVPFVAFLASAFALMIYEVRRARSMYTAFLLIYIVVITSVTYIPSGPRYSICAVPFFILLADAADRSRAADCALTIAFAILNIVFFSLYIMRKYVF